MTSILSKQKKYIISGLVLTATAGVLAVKLRQPSPDMQRPNEPIALHDTDDSAAHSNVPAQGPDLPLPTSTHDDPIDAGQSSEDALRDLGKRIESSLAEGDMEAAANLIAQRSLIQISSAARKDERIHGAEFQRLHLQDMESYANMYPQLQGSYDYRLTLLTAAFAGESLPLLEARIAAIRSQFPQIIDRDNDCIRYFLALRRNDPEPASWKALCESGTSEYSTYSKGMTDTIRKYWQ